MRISLDLIFAAFAIINILSCWILGFAKSLLKLSRIFISLIGALILGHMMGLAGYIIGFIGAFIAVTILSKILDLVTKLPLIHGIDRLLGLLLGLVSTFASLLAIVTGIAYIMGNLPSGVSDFFFNSKIFEFMYEISDELNFIKR